jgi:hypothetical protein
MASHAWATTLTLSDVGLMLLDWHDDVNGAVIAQTDVPGPGVEFEILYPSNVFPDTSLRFASTRWGGAGALSGLDLTLYDDFALTFTLLSIDGNTASGSGDRLVVGALVYDDANGYRYKPEIVDLDRGFGRTATSITPIKATARQDGLGIESHMWIPENWSNSPHTVTYLVQAAPDAVAIPEPVTWGLLMCGAVLCKRRRTKP